MDFNYIDGFVLLALAYSFYKGFSKGFVIVIASFIALILGVVGAMYFSDMVAEVLKAKTEIEEQYISITAFTITFMGIIFGVHLIAKIVNQAVKMVMLGPLNKVMGGVFSMLKTVVILSVVFYIFDFMNSKVEFVERKTLKESIAYHNLIEITETAIPLITKSEWYDPSKIDGVLDDMKDAVEEKVSEELLDN
ncbi:MAG: CvpA family protein [Salibacteraceae bacterium]